MFSKGTFLVLNTFTVNDQSRALQKIVKDPLMHHRASKPMG